MHNVELLIFHLKLKGEQWITVTDSSMYPTLCSQNQIKIIPSETYIKGDIVVFRRDNHLVIHRIIYINKKTINFKGDNNIYLDDDSSEDKIIGKVKGRSLISKLIALLSNMNANKKKSRLYSWFYRSLCYIEHFYLIIAHNLKSNINN